MNNMLGNPRVDLVYVVDADEERWRMVKHALNLNKVQFLKPQEARTVYFDEKVDVVIVATPTYTHTEIIKGALKAGKAVFSEKPIAESVEDTVDCYNVAAKMERSLLCAFNRRFDPAFKNVFRRVREGW